MMAAQVRLMGRRRRRRARAWAPSQETDWVAGGAQEAAGGRGQFGSQRDQGRHREEGLLPSSGADPLHASQAQTGQLRLPRRH